MKSHVWRIVRPKEVVVQGEVRPLRDPQLDGVGLPMEVQHPHGGQACQAEGQDNHQNWVASTKFAVPVKSEK